MRSGWLIIAASFVILAVYRTVSTSFSILVLPLEAELETTRSMVTLVFTAHMLAYAAGSLASGPVIHRFGPGFTIALGGVLFGSGLVLTSLGLELAALLLSFGLLCGLGISLAGLPAVFVVLSSSFHDRVATAMGFAGAGMGIGVLVFVPLLQWVANHIGWRQTFQYAGIASMVVTVACAWLLQRGTGGHSPSGASSRGDASLPRPESDTAERRVWPRMLTIVRSPSWCAFACANLLMGAALFGVVTHQVALFRAFGWTALGAATALGVVNLLRSVAGPLWGMMLDRRRVSIGYGASTICAVAGLACGLLVGVGSLPLDVGLIAFIIGFGIGAGGSLPTNAALGAGLFDRAERGFAWGLTDTAYALGAAIGAWAVGALFDVTGGYNAALVMVSVQLVISWFVVRGIDATWLGAPAGKRIPAHAR